MAGIVMTYALASAIGHDAGNRSMRKAGRASWNQEDLDAASAAMNKALALIPGNPYCVQSEVACAGDFVQEAR